MACSKDLCLAGATTAVIVVGRGFSLTASGASWEALCEAVDALAAALALPLVVVAATDLASAEPDDTIDASAVVGLCVATATGPEPVAVGSDALRSAVTDADAVPWARVGEIVDAIEIPDEPLDEETQLFVVPTGPLAGCHVAFGVPADDEGALPEWTPGSPQSLEPALEFVAGKDQDQRPIAQGVWGVSVLYRGDWETGVLDVGPARHAERTARLGRLAPRAGYYLMASFD